MNELRFASVLLLRRVMERIKDDLEHDDFKAIYEQLLKRAKTPTHTFELGLFFYVKTIR